MKAPDKYTAELKIAHELHRSGALLQAAGMYRAMLAEYPQSFDLQHYMGMAQLQMREPQAAIPYFKTALKLNPQSAAAYCNLGAAYQVLEQHDEALDAFDRALKIKPDFAEGHMRRAALLHGAGRLSEAVDAYRDLLAIREDAGMLNNLGAALRDLRRYEEALEAFGRALSLKPDYAAAMINRGNTLRDLGRPQEAIADYDAVLVRHPDHAEALTNKARATEEAAGRALTADLAEKEDSGVGKADTLDKKEVKRVGIRPELLEYARIFAEDTSIADREDARLQVMMKLSDWSLCHTIPIILQKIRNKKIIPQPFFLVFMPCTARDQLIAGQSYSAQYFPPRKPVWTGEKYAHQKIRVGYLSSDLQRHATAYLMAGMFEAHDRNDFEWIAFSSGADDNSDMRHRLVAGFDEFIDIREMDDPTVAALIRAKEIDILVDLKGFTSGSRIGVLSYRPAPVQVTYLGFPGTTGMQNVDYAIVDQHVVPPANEKYFSENLAFMPDCYQINDNKRAIGPLPSRADVGLPPDAFVFCSFNSNYKISPEIYDVWMRIMQRTPGSVLWTFKATGEAENNLRAEAQKRGVDPARLIFASYMPQEEHLARMSCADLFLDTLPCNAHTTASDALWAGLPLITSPGPTFAGRVASSILYNMDLPELVLPTLQDYEDMAVKLVENPELLADLRQKIAQNRQKAPLFDTPLFTRNIEKLYRVMYERAQAGMPPQRLTL